MLVNEVVKYDLPDPLSTIFAALADPTRRALLERLSLGETTVNELAAPFDLSLPAISKHLKVLEQAGLISRGRQAQWRPCRIEVEPLEQVAAWTQRYSDLWGGSLDNLDSYLKKLQSKNNGDKR